MGLATYRVGGLNCRCIFHQPLDIEMKAQLKNAVITTGIVLATIYVLRRVTATKTIVDKALLG